MFFRGFSYRYPILKVVLKLLILAGSPVSISVSIKLEKEDMTSEEILKITRRKRKEFLPGPEPRYDQWPIDGDWLSTYPFLLFLNEAHKHTYCWTPA